MSSIAYINRLYPDTVSFHVFKMNKTFCRTEEKADEHLEKFINYINRH